VTSLLYAVVPVLILATAAFLAVRQSLRDPPRYEVPRGLDPDRAGIDLILRARPSLSYPVHLYAPEGTAFVTGCCGRDVFSLPEEHRTTPHQDRVACDRSGGES